MTDARLGPTSWMSEKQRRNASAVHTIPSTTSDIHARPVSAEEGGASTAAGASSTVATASATASGPSGCTSCIRAARDIDAEQQRDAAEPHEQPDEPQPGHPLAVVEAQREQGDDERQRGDEDRGQRARDHLLARGDERERQHDLGDRERDDRPAREVAQHPAPNSARPREVNTRRGG